MGCEDFQVLLRFELLCEEVLCVLGTELWVSVDPQGGLLADSVYLGYKDGRHVIEMEVSSSGRNSTAMSLRFAVCHPDTIDEVFIDLVARLANTLRAEVSLMEDIEPGVRGDFCRASSGRSRKPQSGLSRRRGHIGSRISATNAPLLKL